jgi:hypothetical protein
VGTYGKIPTHSEHPAMKVQSNRVVITEANSPVVSPNEGSKTNVVLVQSQLKGVNKVILSEGVAIPARSEMVIEGKIQAKDISQVGMISASQADSVRHLQGLHVAHLVVTPVGKTVPVRIANTTTNKIELPKGCKLAEFCPILEQEAVANNTFPVNCNAMQADNLGQKINYCLDAGLSNSEKQQVKQVLGKFKELFSDTIGQTNIAQHKIDTSDNLPIRQRAR